MKTKRQITVTLAIAFIASITDSHAMLNKISEIKCNQTKLAFANEDTDRFGGNFTGHSDQTKIAHSEWCRLQTYLQEIYSCRDIFARIRFLSRLVICKTVMQRSCSLQALLISEPVEQIENSNSSQDTYYANSFGI